MEKPHIVVFYGSARPNASAPKIAAWLKGKLDATTDMTFEYINLAELDLPLMNLEGAIVPDATPTLPSLQTWATAIKNADGFIVVTNEYNHGVTAIIKNAIDYLKLQWAHKPVAFISYGGALGGGRAVEHLRQIFAELEAVTVRDTIFIPHVYSNFDENNTLKEEAVHGDLSKVLEKLLWWSKALMGARNTEG